MQHSDRRALARTAASCPFAGGRRPSSTAASSQPILSLCPFAAAGKKKANPRTLFTKIGERRFSSPSVQRNESTIVEEDAPRSFWDIYQEIANQHTGFLGDVQDSATLQDYPILQGLVNLAETESPEQYAKNDADGYRLWIETRLNHFVCGKDSDCLQKELNMLNRAQLQMVLCGSAFLRHHWHQGDATAEPVTDIKPTDSQGNQLEEPALITTAVEYAANKLGVAPYINLYSYLFCNWKWTPSGDNKGIDFSSVTHEKLCDVRAGKLDPRFVYLAGEERESEANLWRGFAYSELMAVPMYGEIGRLIDQVNQVNGRPSPEAIVVVLDCLSNIRLATRNICAALVAYIHPEVLDPSHFLKFQHTVFYAEQTTGVSGFQLPAIVMLDTLLGVDYTSNVPPELEGIRANSITEMLPEVQELIFDHVQPAGIKLRKFIEKVSCPQHKEELQQAFNAIANEFMLLRASHRARAGKYLKNSSNTSSRSSGGGDVLAAFNSEMSCIIAATKKAFL